MSGKTWPRYAALGVFFLLGVLFWRGQQVPPVVATPPASSSARPPPSSPSGPPIPALDGLRSGERIGEWIVDEVLTNSGPGDSPQLELTFVRAGGAGFSVYITPRDKFPTALSMTKKYGVSHGNHRPGAEVPADAEQLVVKELVRRLEKNEATAPTLPGL